MIHGDKAAGHIVPMAKEPDEVPRGHAQLLAARHPHPLDLPVRLLRLRCFEWRKEVDNEFLVNYKRCRQWPLPRPLTLPPVP